MQHIGLGAGAEIVRIEVDWPAGARGGEGRTAEARPETQVVRDVPVNGLVVVKEGVAGFEVVPRVRFELGVGDAASEAHAGHGGS